MQRHESGGDGIINGFVLLPAHLVGETTNRFAHELTSRVSSSSDDFYAKNFSPSPQTMSFHGTNHFMEGIPLPNAPINTFPCEKYISFENQERQPIPVPFENVISTSFDSMLHSYGGPPCPPELIGRVVGRTSVHLPMGPPPHSCYSRDWPNMDQNQLGLSSDSRDSSQLSNELSLSLVTSRPSILNVHSSIHEQSFEQSSEMSSNGSGTSYSLMLRSRFVEAMQEILAEVACYALENIEDFGVNNLLSSSSIEGNNTSMLQKQEMSLEAKKKHLLVLLQMVDEQYSQCIDEIHTVTSAFHAVTELSPNLHVCFALPAISFMYKSLRERISSHIVAIEAHQKEGETREQNSSEARFVQKQWALQQQLSKRDHHQMWRPQRGLPETSVSVLRTWMFQNFLHPYPKDSEKQLLALRSGLTRSQVSNWFINARVRLWKPMIEEMCAEMNRRKALKENEEMEGNHRNQMWSETRRFTRD